MKRIQSRERPDYLSLVRAQGLVYTHEDDPEDALYKYWREDAYYSFTHAEIALLETATREVFEMCVAAGDWLVDPANRTYLYRLGIPVFAFSQVIESWNAEPASGSVYGRFDVRFGGIDHPDPAMRVPKFYEFNADTPTSLVESVIQWFWLENTGRGADQWNSIAEDLVEAWRRNLALIEQRLGHRPVVHFSASSAQTEGEDEMNTMLLLDTCQQAGYDTATIYVENIVLGDDGRFYDERGMHIDVIFKLYPWEHLVDEEFGRAAFADMENVGRRDAAGEYTGGTVWIEPPYKMLWSNKGLMAVLWKLFGDDPERSRYLIPTWFENEAPGGRAVARKPLLSREGADITLLDAEGAVIDRYQRDEYGAEGFVLQEYTPPPAFPDQWLTDQHPVLGCWVIDGEPAGMGIRESTRLITDDFANFVPHAISDGDQRFVLTPPVVPFRTTHPGPNGT